MAKAVRDPFKELDDIHTDELVEAAIVLRSENDLIRMLKCIRRGINAQENFTLMSADLCVSDKVMDLLIELLWVEDFAKRIVNLDLKGFDNIESDDAVYNSFFEAVFENCTNLELFSAKFKEDRRRNFNFKIDKMPGLLNMSLESNACLKEGDFRTFWDLGDDFKASLLRAERLQFLCLQNAGLDSKWLKEFCQDSKCKDLYSIDLRGNCFDYLKEGDRVAKNLSLLQGGFDTISHLYMSSVAKKGEKRKGEENEEPEKDVKRPKVEGLGGLDERDGRED